MAKYTMTEVIEAESWMDWSLTQRQRELILAVLNNPEDVGLRAVAG